MWFSGLAIRVKLYRSLPPRFKVDVQIRPGTHASEVAVNKQVKVQRRINLAKFGKHFCLIFFTAYNLMFLKFLTFILFRILILKNSYIVFIKIIKEYPFYRFFKKKQWIYFILVGRQGKSCSSFGERPAFRGKYLYNFSITSLGLHCPNLRI